MPASFFFAGSIIVGIIYLAIPNWLVLDPFEFRDLSLNNLKEGIWIFCLMWASAIIGHAIAGFIPANIRSDPSLCKLQRPLFKGGIQRSGLPFLIVFFVLFSYLSYKILVNTINIGSTGLDERVFIDKSSQYILLAFGASAYGAMKKCGAFFRNAIEILLIFICLLISIVDMSREALIPTAFILLFYLQRTEHRFKIMFWLFICAVLLSLVMLRRDFDLIDIIDQPLNILIVYFFESISYITAFNLFHFTQVIQEGDTGFTWSLFVLSVSPLPSSLLGSDIFEGRNFDAFRPYGASADMFFLSPIVLSIYWVLFGLVAQISTRKTGLLRVILIALLLIVFVTSFQYHLRTSSKFFILILLLLGIDWLIGRLQLKMIKHQP